MRIYKKADDITRFIDQQNEKKLSVGFVPTMGALHEGHIALIKESKKECNITICSIFVNPTQFNNPQDFEKYPSTIEADIALLELAGCDALFLPEFDEIYPPSFETEHYNLGYLEEVLEGKYRPGHFQGVCMVVDRLLSIIKCNQLFLGLKDYQQCLVIQKMIELKNYPVQIHFCDTVREPNGLAMSSRNKRLTPAEREVASVLFSVLNNIKQKHLTIPVNKLLTEAKSTIEQKGFMIDYLTITNNKLQELQTISDVEQPIVLVAATLNQVRLIDNMALN